MSILNYIKNNTVNAFLRFPSVAVLALAATVVSFYYIYYKIDFDDFRVIYSMLLGLPLYFAIEIFYENKLSKKVINRILLYLVCAGLLFLFHWLVVSDDTYNFYVKVLQISLIVHLLVSFILFLGKKSDDDEKFWNFNNRLFVNINYSFIFGFVFFLGTFAALLVVKKLFSFPLPDKAPAYLVTFSFFTLSTLFFLGGTSKSLIDFKGVYINKEKLPTLFQYLLVPLGLLYILILYVYIGKVLLSGEWPSGYVGWLVSVVSTFGVFVLLFLDQYKQKHTWLRKLSVYFYIAILPLLGVLFAAVFKRITHYGVTEQRYFLLVLGVSLLLSSLYFIFSKRKSIKFIPITLFFMSIFSLFGPWSAYNISLNSQMKQLESIFVRHKLLKDGKLIPVQESTSFEETARVRDILNYIIRYHGREHLSHWFPKEVVEKTGKSGFTPGYSYHKARKQNSGEMLEYLNISEGWYDNHGEYVSYNIDSLKTNYFLDTADYSKMFMLDFFGANRSSEVQGYLFELGEHNLNLSVQLLNSKKISLDLSNHLEILNNPKNKELKHFVYRGVSEGVPFKLVLSSIRAYKKEIKDRPTFKVDAFQAYLFLNDD